MSAEGENQPQSAAPKPAPKKSSGGGLYAVLGLVAVLGVAEVGGAYYFGTQAETKLKDFVAAQNAQMEFFGYGENAVTIESYEKGMFSSNAIVKTSINFPAANGPLEFEQPVEVLHGPVLFGTGGFGLGVVRIAMEADIISVINQVMPQMSPEPSPINFAGGMKVTSYYTLGFTGDYTMGCSAPPSKVDVAPAEGMAMTISPGTISCSGNVSSDFMSMDGEMRIANGTVEIPEMGGVAGTLTDGVIGFDLQYDPEDLPSFSYSFEIGELSVPSIQLSVTNFKAKSSMPKSEGETVAIQSTSSVEKVEFVVPQDQTVVISPIEVEDSYNDISKALVRKYFELYGDIMAAAGGDEAAIEAKFQDPAFQEEMMAVVNEALAHGPDYNMSKFRVAVPDNGEANLTFAIGVPEGTSFDPEDAEAIANAIEADLTFAMDRAMAVYVASVGMKAEQPNADPAEVEQMAGGMVDQSVGSVPFLKVEDGVIKTTISVRNQMITINDMEPMTVDQLMGMFGMGGGGAQPPMEPSDDMGGEEPQE